MEFLDIEFVHDVDFKDLEFYKELILQMNVFIQKMLAVPESTIKFFLKILVKKFSLFSF